MGLPAAKLDQLRALLSSLPPDTARRLCHAAGQGDPSMARLLDYCLGDAQGAARARFFEPLEPVSGVPGEARPSRAWTPKPLLEKLWTWLAEDLDPALIEQAREVADRHAAQTSGAALDALRREAADRIEAALAAIKDDPKKTKLLQARLGVDRFDAPRRAASLLRSAPVLRKALDGLPTMIVDLTDQMSATIRDRYEEASAEDPDAAVWVLFMLMARLDRPWRLLRVFERISHREDDLLVSQTDMAHIGEALLADAEHHLSGFARAPSTQAEAADAAQALAEFSAVTVGMTREIGIRKEGAWGKRLFELRARASAQMEGVHAAARDAVARATPEAGGVKGRAGARDGENLPERARALCRFLFLTKDDAARAAVGGAHGSLLDEIADRLETAGARTLDALRTGAAKDPDMARARLNEIGALMKAIGQCEAAEILLRRSAAALAA